MNEFLEKHLEWIVGVILAAVVWLIARAVWLKTWMMRVDMMFTEYDTKTTQMQATRDRVSDILQWMQGAKQTLEAQQKTVEMFVATAGGNKERLIRLEQEVIDLGRKIDEHFARQNGTIQKIGDAVVKVQENCLRHYKQQRDKQEK